MKSSIAKVALAIGAIMTGGAAYGGPAQTHSTSATGMGRETTLDKIADGSVHLAKESWNFSKRAANTAVHSPVIAYQVVRGERPLFPNGTAKGATGHHESMALTGHRTAKPNQGPPI